MIFTGLLKDPRPEWGLPIAMAISMNPNIGTRIGQFIYYKDNCSEITDISKTQYCLVVCGWVNKKECRLIR
jgi:hypothetical protein